MSCSKDTLNVPNENNYTGSSFFTTNTTITEASTAMYTPLLYPGMYDREFYYIFDFLGDDADRNFPLEGDLIDFPIYAVAPTNAEVSELFTSSYDMVFRANFLINTCSTWKTTNSTDSALKVRVVGEAEFLKSQANFWLVNCFGAIPLKKKLADHYNLQQGRTPVDTIWADIISNLKDAITRLPVSYDAADYGRVTKGAAVALLGKAYLYTKDYTDALTQFQSLTQSPYNYALTKSLDDLFVNKKPLPNPEEIFCVIHDTWQGWGVGNAYYMFGGQETWGAKNTADDREMEYGFRDWWNTVVSQALVSAFTYKDESNNTYHDPRAQLTYYSNTAQGGDTTFCSECPNGTMIYDTVVKTGEISWRKYEEYEWRPTAYGQPDGILNSQVIRYADVLLMLAECYIQNNQVNLAMPLINQVRARSGAFQYMQSYSQSQAFTLLQRERQLELAGEQTRYFDLVRWGTLISTINAEKLISDGIQPVQSYMVLLPIPQQERDANPVLNAQVKGNYN